MRALLINPVFPPSYWTLKNICQFAGRKTLLPPLGLLTVAALLPPDWELRLVDLNTRQLTADDWQWADLVLISGMIIQRQGILENIAVAKQQGKTVIAGGPYATSLSQEVLAGGADFLARGEGETTIPRLLGLLQAGERRGVVEETGKPEMSASPVPRFDLLNLDDYTTLGIQTSRGCPFDCEFCDVVNLYGRKPRYKTPEQVLAELETLFRLGWRREVFISDDNFIGNPDHARAILRQLIPWMKSHGEPFSFWTQASVNLGNNLKIIDLLTEANFSTVFLGVETPDPALLKSNRKYQNLRNPLGDSLTAINANGLSMVASFMMGFDGEQAGAGDRICEFVEEYHIPVVMVNLLHAIPNTGFYDRLQRENRLLGGHASGDYYILDFNFVPTRDPAEIKGEYIRVIDRLYEPSRYLSRLYRFFLVMRPTRQHLAQQKAQPEATATPAHLNQSSQRGLQDLIALGRIIWRRGIVPSYRFQFWRQWWGIYRRNPSRMVRYLQGCAFGEDLYSIRERILQNRSGISGS
jgi:radical SAM superfamily enzyme YgiQ (UPF0313 family)